MAHISCGFQRFRASIPVSSFSSWDRDAPSKPARNIAATVSENV